MGDTVRIIATAAVAIAAMACSLLMDLFASPEREVSRQGWGVFALIAAAFFAGTVIASAIEEQRPAKTEEDAEC